MSAPFYYYTYQAYAASSGRARKEERGAADAPQFSVVVGADGDEWRNSLETLSDGSQDLQGWQEEDDLLEKEASARVM